MNWGGGLLRWRRASWGCRKCRMEMCEVGNYFWALSINPNQINLFTDEVDEWAFGSRFQIEESGSRFKRFKTGGDNFRIEIILGAGWLRVERNIWWMQNRFGETLAECRSGATGDWWMENGIKLNEIADQDWRIKNQGQGSRRVEVILGSR